MINVIRTASNWITWTVDPKDEWATWEAWQNNQSEAHFESSAIFKYYMSYRPSKPPNYLSNSLQSKYYKYCFGEFAQFIIFNHASSSAFDYFTLLLDIYDTCKGMTRRIT